jgi:hypothetical protein
VVWGDSLTVEATPYVGAEVRAHNGLAPCDYLDEIRQRVRTNPPAVAVLAFVGNNLTACTGGVTGQALVDNYRYYAEAITNELRVVGTRVVWAAAPPFSTHAGRNPINAAYEGLGLRWDTANSVTLSGRFAWNLSCLPGECVGQVPVRHKDGVHLAPSGMRRYGKALTASAS